MKLEGDALVLNGQWVKVGSRHMPVCFPCCPLLCLAAPLVLLEVHAKGRRFERAEALITVDATQRCADVAMAVNVGLTGAAVLMHGEALREPVGADPQSGGHRFGG